MHCVNDDPNSVQFSDQALSDPRLTTSILGPDTRLMDTRMMDYRMSDPFGGGGMPGGYPLALSGLRGNPMMRSNTGAHPAHIAHARKIGYMAGLRAYRMGGLRGLAETKAQADAAAKKAATAQAAAKKAADTAQAAADKKAAAVASAKNATQAANLQKQATAAQAKANTAQAKLTTATTNAVTTSTAAAAVPTPPTAAQTAAAKKATTAATTAAKKAAATAAKTPPDQNVLSTFMAKAQALQAKGKANTAKWTAALQKAQALAATKKRAAPAKAVAPKLRGLAGLLGFLFGGKPKTARQAGTRPLHPFNRVRRGGTHGLGYFGDYCDPSTGQYVSDPTSPPINPATCPASAGGAPTQQVTIDPITGLPTAVGVPTLASLGAPAPLSSDPDFTLMMQMMQQGQTSTPPKGCTNPSSTKPACVMYNMNQQQQQTMMIVLMMISQMSQQEQQMMQQIMAVLQSIGSAAGAGATTLPAGMCLDSTGNQVPCAGVQTQTPVPPGYYVDPNTGQLVPQQSPVYSTPYAPAAPTAPPGYYVDPTTGQLVPQQAAAPYAPPVDPYSGSYTPSASLPIAAQSPYVDPNTGQQIDPMYAGQQAAPMLPYAPGGGVPQPYDPNMAPQYAGMPSPNDPYGDVAMLPPGSDGGGGGGGGGDYIPQDIPVSYGPIAYNDYSSDVAQLPPGAYDTGGDSGDSGLPTEVDPYGDASMQIAPQQMMMAQQYQMTPSGPPQQGQQIVSQGAPPQQIMMTAPDSQGMGPLMTEDQGQIVADAFTDGGDFS